jgi:hypothetical protein
MPYHPRMLKFVQMYYDTIDYSKMLDDFIAKNSLRSKETYLFEEFAVFHLRKFLNTSMVYPDGREILVKNLPENEINEIIDCFGEEIGVSSILRCWYQKHISLMK